MAWEPIAVGLVATALAAFQIVAWTAIGQIFAAREQEPRLALPLAVLIGVALTSCAYALFAWAGRAHMGIAVVAVGGGVAIALRAAATRSLFLYLRGCYRELCAGRRWAAWLVGAWMAFYWAMALAPPRDADVLRYHLAKIYLIDAENVWAPILHFCHSLPFGWSIQYLPFEHLGIPQGGHLLNLGLLVMAVGIAFDVMRRLGASHGLTAALCAVFAFQPWVMKVATTGYVDMHVHFIMWTLAALVAAQAVLDPRRLAMLGFVAWVGAQARYQAVLVGITVSLLVLVWAARRRVGPRGLVAFGMGGAAALLLSAPWYVYNWILFHNPVWPLLVPIVNGLETYTDQVANSYQSATDGSRTVDYLARAALRLLIHPEGAPVAALAFGLIGVAAFARPPAAVRALGTLVGIFVVIWAYFHPPLYARYGTYLAAWVFTGWAPVLTQWSSTPWLRTGIRAALAALLVGELGLASWYSYDPLRYVVSGDLVTYHTFTPFWTVYDWANRNTPPDSKYLVVVTSGHTYHLDRIHRQVEPTMGSEIEWPALETAEDLDRTMAERDFDYLIYEDRDWSMDVGGTQMARVVDAAVREGRLRPIAHFDTRYFTSRIKRTWLPQSVYVLERSAGSASGTGGAPVPWRAAPAAAAPAPPVGG